jgi:hypothetical protein
VKFARLSKAVRQKVLDEHRDWNVTHDWWDSVYEDAVRMAALMGVEIDTVNRPRTPGPAGPTEYDIDFSGFSSQGDGASFSGSYCCKPDAVKKITEECGGNDPVLIEIATKLTALQIAVKLEQASTLRLNICKHQHYGVHPLSMYVTDVVYEDDEVGTGDADLDNVKVTDAMEALFRRFADWIYHQLEQEYEHQTSDEAITEALQDYRFDRAGAII